MLPFFTVVHVILCVFMIFVILLQPGKDAGMGAALGGGAATSAFGGRGAVTFLSKLTGVCAGLFFLTSMGLSFVGLKGSVADADDSVAAQPPAQSAPATAGQATPAPAGAPPSVEQPRTDAPPAPAQGNQAAPAAPAPAQPQP